MYRRRRLQDLDGVQALKNISMSVIYSVEVVYMQVHKRIRRWMIRPILVLGHTVRLLKYGSGNL